MIKTKTNDMKQTSIKAYANKERFADSHRGRILKALTEPMNGVEIAFKTGLTQHQVMRRLSELERDLKVFVAGVKDNQSIYYLCAKQTSLTHELHQFEVRESKYLKRLKGLRKEFTDLMPIDLVICIDLEII